MTPECQSDINLSLRASPAFHLWRNEWQRCIKKTHNRMASCCFYSTTSVPRDRGLWEGFRPRAQVRLKDIFWDRWQEMQVSGCDSPITTVTSLISITQLSSPSFGHYFLHLASSPMRRQNSTYRPWNVSPHWVWHLQIRAHYLGVTRPVPFIFTTGRAGCVCAAMHWGIYEQSHKFNSLLWI